MKKIVKILVVILLAVFVVTGCNNEEEGGNNQQPKTSEYDDYNKNIEVANLGKYDGEFDIRFAVLKISNYNSVPVYVDAHYEMYDSNKSVMYTKDVLLRVPANRAVYAIARQDPEEETFNSFSYNVKVREEKISDYDEVFNNISISGRNDGNNIIVNVSNKSKRTTNIYGLVIFYRSSKIVEIKEANEYNLMPTSVRDITVEYPYNINFDKFEVVLNEVGTEL